MTITRTDLYLLGFRNIENDGRKYINSEYGIYAYCYPFTDTTTPNTDFFRVDMRSEPPPPDKTTTDWEIVTHTDEVVNSMGKLTYHKDRRKLMGFHPEAPSLAQMLVEANNLKEVVKELECQKTSQL